MSRPANTLLGIPFEVDTEAPRDRIRLHPDVLQKIEEQAFSIQVQVSKDNDDVALAPASA